MRKVFPRANLSMKHDGDDIGTSREDDWKVFASYCKNLLDVLKQEDSLQRTIQARRLFEL